MPTYYLEKGQEFQIELFNPTSDVLLAKIILNGKAISQGGLVLNPGQRVFLDRYFDVAKKFLFDTYEVANTTEVKKAIENNGDIRIEFYKEITPVVPFVIPQTWITKTFTYTQPIIPTFDSYDSSSNNLRNLSNLSNPKETFSSTGTITTNGMVNNTTIAGAAAFTSSVSDRSFGDIPTYDMSASLDFSPTLEEPAPMLKKSIRAKKSIETGRVEQGSYSDQKFKTVNKEFEYFPFHTIEYKLLPISQKINTSEDLNVKRYCTNCGHKLGKTDKFCSSCGTKA
jgi:hypothetical protein